MIFSYIIDLYLKGEENKKIITLVLLALIIAGCSSKGASYEFDEAAILSKEETKEALADALNNKGKSIEYTGRVSMDLYEDENYTYYEVLQNIEKFSDELVIRVPREMSKNLSMSDFLYGTGVIIGTLEETKVLGPKGSTALVEINDVESGDYIDTIGRAIKTIEINKSQAQNGHSVTIDKVEVSEHDTRLFLTVKNDNENKIHMSSYRATIVAGGKNYAESSNYRAEYPEIVSELNPKTSTEGIISFVPIDFDTIQSFWMQLIVMTGM